MTTETDATLFHLSLLANASAPPTDLPDSERDAARYMLSLLEQQQVKQDLPEFKSDAKPDSAPTDLPDSERDAARYMLRLLEQQQVKQDLPEFKSDAKPDSAAAAPADVPDSERDAARYMLSLLEQQQVKQDLADLKSDAKRDFVDDCKPATFDAALAAEHSALTAGTAHVATKR